MSDDLIIEPETAMAKYLAMDPKPWSSLCTMYYHTLCDASAIRIEIVLFGLILDTFNVDFGVGQPLLSC